MTQRRTRNLFSRPPLIEHKLNSLTITPRRAQPFRLRQLSATRCLLHLIPQGNSTPEPHNIYTSFSTVTPARLAAIAITNGFLDPAYLTLLERIRLRVVPQHKG